MTSSARASNDRGPVNPRADQYVQKQLNKRKLNGRQTRAVEPIDQPIDLAARTGILT
jgi:hypothetical protein